MRRQRCDYRAGYNEAGNGSTAVCSRSNGRPQRRPQRQPQPRPQLRRAASTSPGGSATACTVGVSWNNFQQPRWAAHDKPNIQKTVEAAGGTYIDADANLSNEQQLTDIDTLISKGAKVLIVLAQDTKAVLPAIQKAKRRRHPGHRL